MGQKEDLDALIAAFDREVHSKSPNPERVGCPGRAALTRLATKPEALGTLSILDHVRKCGACLDELKSLRMSSERSEQ